MKKLLIAAGLFLSGLSASAQLTVAGTDVLPVNRNGLQSVIVERVIPSAAAGLPAGSVTYRLFVDMEENYQFLAASGYDNTNPLTYITIRSTQAFYNETAFGGASGASANPSLYGFAPALQYDTYGADGRIGSTNVGVLTSVNANGYVPINANSTPAGDLSIPAPIAIFTDPAATELYDYNSGWIVAGAVGGPDAAVNQVFIGQLTTAGELTMDLNISLQNPYGQIRYIPNIEYPVAPDLAPTVSLVTPANGTTFNVNDVITIGAHADDDNAVTYVEFFVNGVSVGIDNTDNGQTDATLPTHTITWTAVGTTAQVYAVVSDGVNPAVTSSTVTININDPFPTNVALTVPTAGNYNLSPITLTATASDGDQTITTVEFLVNGVVVGSDNNGADGWSTVYTPVAANNVNISARALGVVSVPVVVSFANAAPSVSISTPVAPFNLTVGNDTTFVATVSDPDGTVSSVAFIMGGSVVATDNTAPFEYVYNAGVPGNYSISARATDNLGAQTTSAPVAFTTVFAAGGGYAILPVVDYCSGSDVFCVPVVTTAAVADVIGYDIEMLYDNSKVTPTGIVIVGEELIADRDWTSYSYNVVNESLIRISIYFNGTAPAGTEFTGEGTVFCVEFSRNYNFGDVDTAEFTIPLISESYANFVSDIDDNITGTYRTIQETIFNGSLSFWSDNSPIAYVNGTNLITEIYGDVTGNNVATNVTPNANGQFVYDITNGTNITISRDIANTTNVQTVINGYDAYLTSKVSVEDASFRPNVYQIIAMDVNRDGRIAAGDITQISQRAVSRLDQFSQDWVWVASATVLNNPSYRISDAYPRPDADAANGVGYSRNLVPVPSNLIELPIDHTSSCISIGTENYKGIMVGDADGSYSSIPADINLKSGAEELIIVDLAQRSIFASYSSAVKSIDLQFKGEFASDLKVKSNNGLTVTTNIINDELHISAYGDVKSDDLAILSFEGTIVVNEVALSNINGENNIEVELKSASSPSNINGTSVDDIKLYPNPVKTELQVSVNTDSKLEIYNAAGARVLSVDVFNGVNSVNVSFLPKGVYVAKFISNEKVESINIIIE
ncbi:MAG: T9SS type A sorting domain-containing protein [Bacteroidales bacterium]|nr:T9SS type A sorting domain-containing protein [Bacteroidales bacterium]